MHPFEYLPRPAAVDYPFTHGSPLSRHRKRSMLPTAMTKPQLATGPQKCVVFGPVGDFQKAPNLLPNARDDAIVDYFDQQEICLLSSRGLDCPEALITSTCCTQSKNCNRLTGPQRRYLGFVRQQNMLPDVRVKRVTC